MSVASRFIFIEALLLASGACALDFGLRADIRSVSLLQDVTYRSDPRCCGLGLLAEIPIGARLTAGLRAGLFGSTTRWTFEDYPEQLEDVLGQEGRAVVMANARLAGDATTGHAGLSIGYSHLKYWFDSHESVMEQCAMAGALIGVKHHLSRSVSTRVEAEVPVVGWFRDVLSSPFYPDRVYTGRRFANFAPSLSIAFLLTP